jgi:hypothetical protein
MGLDTIDTNAKAELVRALAARVSAISRVLLAWNMIRVSPLVRQLVEQRCLSPDATMPDTFLDGGVWPTIFEGVIFYDSDQDPTDLRMYRCPHTGERLAVHANTLISIRQRYKLTPKKPKGVRGRPNGSGLKLPITKGANLWAQGCSFEEIYKKVDGTGRDIDPDSLRRSIRRRIVKYSPERQAHITATRKAARLKKKRT